MSLKCFAEIFLSFCFLCRKCGTRDVKLDSESVDAEPVPSTSKDVDIAHASEATKSYEDYPKRTPTVATKKVPKWFKPL